MKDVAAYKKRNNLPIEDSEREKAVLVNSVQAGLRVGLTRQTSTAFFQSQIEAAKEIQRYWMEHWREGGAPTDVRDLNSELRPELLEIGEQIIEDAAGGNLPHPDQFIDDLSVEGLSEGTKNKLYVALMALSVYPDRLSQILDSGVLRIGTTGDYEPFSIRRRGEDDFSGIDIDLGKDLAVALGVKPIFVHTSWPTLIADLNGGKFDIAMSGVSRTLERQRQGFFSRPYHIGGKTAISRCSDSERFQSLADIDQADVRVIVNPGGTNEQFVNSRIRQANKIVHEDNRTVFVQILSGKADVMITDRIEADWQVAANASLCTPLEGNLTYQEKAYLMPRDIVLKEFVNTWLSLRIAEGKLNQLLSLQ